MIVTVIILVLAGVVLANRIRGLVPMIPQI